MKSQRVVIDFAIIEKPLKHKLVLHGSRHEDRRQIAHRGVILLRQAGLSIDIWADAELIGVLQ